MIRLSRLCALSIALSVLMSSGAYGQTVFLARKALGAIKRHTSQSQGYDMATVLLQADADNVYRTAVDLLGNNPAVRITSTDRTGRAVEFTDGGRTISLKVNRIQEDTAQLIVGSPLVQGKESPVPVVVEKIAHVCAQMGVACAVSND